MKKEDFGMKKLLILLLVLCVVSMTSATPMITGPDEIDIDVGYITLTLQGTSAEASDEDFDPSNGGYEGAVWVDYSAYSGQISNVGSADANMGVNASIDLTTYLPSDGGVPFAAAPGASWTEETDVDVGDWFTFRVTMLSGAEEDDEYDVQVLNDSWGIVYTHTVTVVPEPMTIALLGLGGLFLRRRK